jgi:hypothetical protein
MRLSRVCQSPSESAVEKAVAVLADHIGSRNWKSGKLFLSRRMMTGSTKGRDQFIGIEFRQRRANIPNDMGLNWCVAVWTTAA